jgi:hypothetical protein
MKYRYFVETELSSRLYCEDIRHVYGKTILLRASFDINMPPEYRSVVVGGNHVVYEYAKD